MRNLSPTESVMSCHYTDVMSLRRSRTFQLRLSDEEYEQLSADAKQRKESISDYLRTLAKLKAPEGQRDFDQPKNMQAIGEVLRKAAAKAQEMETEPARDERGPMERNMDDKAFKQLVAQLQSRMSLSEAEDEARKRLGME
jgi:hypothetical protein